MIDLEKKKKEEKDKLVDPPKRQKTCGVAGGS